MPTATADTLDAAHSAPRTLEPSADTVPAVTTATDTVPDALTDARTAIEAQREAEQEARRQQGLRDQAMYRLSVQHGWHPPRIARELGLSTSLVRTMLRIVEAHAGQSNVAR